MSDTPIGNLFSALNNALDSKIATRIGLRKFLNKASYKSAYNGVQLVSKASTVFKASGKQKKAERLKKTDRKDLFDLSLTDDQQMIQDTIKDFANQYIRVNAEKCSEEGQIPKEIYEAYNNLGLNYYAVPEALGGVMNDKSTVTQMIMAETLAYGDLGMALALLSPLGVLNALVAWGSAQQQEKYIPPFLSEEKIIGASIAVNEPSVLFDPFDLNTKAKKSGNTYTLNGVKSAVPVGQNAALFLVAANTEEGPQVFIVEGGAKGVTIERDKGMGLRSAELTNIVLKNVKVEEDNILVKHGQYGDFINHIRLAWCSMAVGTSQAVLDYTIEYCNNREAFGEPISHRQAVAFMIADIKIEVEGMRVLTQRAVSRAEQGLNFKEQAYLASTFCSEHSMTIGTNGVQLLGGYGFCRDYPVERWYRDLRAVAINYNGVHL